jgi:L-lysine 2,3-aminomutase
MVLHANHARELDAEVACAVGRLRRAGVLLLNQAVLLAGVNDSAEAQCQLSLRLIDIGVTPYYLHQLDRVRGAAHFEVPIDHGRKIMAEMRRRLPGYAVPQYVHEQPGAAHKMNLA